MAFPYGVEARERPKLDAGVPVYTVFIWLIVLMPLLGLPFSLAFTPHIVIEKIGPDNLKTIDPASIYTPGYFVSIGFSLVLYGLSVYFAFLDRRQLIRRGMVRPFQWAWAFLYTPVYVIGRSVVVHGVAPKRGLWPIWVYAAVLVIGIVVGAVRSAGLLHSLY